MVGLTPPPHDWVGNNGKPIYFDSIDNSAYILGKAQHSARELVDLHRRRDFQRSRADIGGDPKEPWVHIAWKYPYTAKDTWLGPQQNLGRSARLQPDDGPVREVRHDLQRRRRHPGAVDVAR